MARASDSRPSGIGPNPNADGVKITQPSGCEPRATLGNPPTTELPQRGCRCSLNLTSALPDGRGSTASAAASKLPRPTPAPRTIPPPRPTDNAPQGKVVSDPPSRRKR